MYSNACSHCGTETKGLLYPRQKRLGALERFAHCLAYHGWLDYCPRLDELSADTMYVSEWIAVDPTDSLDHNSSYKSEMSVCCPKTDHIPNANTLYVLPPELL